MFVQFDPSANQAAAPAAPAANQNVNNSQIIGSQLMPQRQQVQQVQGQSSFYSQQPQNLQQTGFYQAQQSANPSLTNPMQQVTAPTQYNMQGFGAQPQGLNLPIQTVLPGQSQLNKSAPPFKPAAQQLPASSPAASSQDPSQFMMWNTKSNIPQMPGVQLNKPTSQGSGSVFQGNQQQSSYLSRQQNQQQTGNQGDQGQSLLQNQAPGSSQGKPGNQRGGSNYQQKLNYMGQPVQPSGQFMRNQLQMLGLHAPPAGTNTNRYNNNPLQQQHPNLMNQQQQQQPGQQASGGQNTGRSQRNPAQHHQPSAHQPATHQPAGPPRGGGGGGGPGGSMRDLQAKQRAELLQSVQSFLNPATTAAAAKPPMSPKKEPVEESSPAAEPESKEEKESNNNKEKDNEPAE